MTINDKPFDLFGMMMGMPGGTAAPTQ
jgi:hypothetical protein